MTAQKDGLIQFGCPHRVLCDTEMLIYDYDASGIEIEILHEGDAFQPWEPHELRWGKTVPITLGDQAKEFDYGVSSYKRHFLKWDDFFYKCRIIEPEINDSPNSLNPHKLADLGFSLAKEMIKEGDKFFFKDSRYDNWSSYADQMWRTAQEILNLLNNTEVREKLENSLLLTRATKLPYSATLDERIDQFYQLHSAFVDFAHTKESWEEHFAANRQKFIEIWEASKRWELEFQEKKLLSAERARLRKEREATQFAENLAFAKDKYSKPARAAPCFAETRKNGLNCNRNDLVEIKKLPAVFSTDKKIEISIKKCIQCWQLYKECFEVDESTKQFRNYFVKPNKTVAENSFHFSSAEAEEYNKIDFTNFVDPNL